MFAHSKFGNRGSVIGLYVHMQQWQAINVLYAKHGERSFAFAAPTIWNSLPLYIRSCTSNTTFRALLKTHFFAP